MEGGSWVSDKFVMFWDHMILTLARKQNPRYKLRKSVLKGKNLVTKRAGVKIHLLFLTGINPKFIMRFEVKFRCLAHPQMWMFL